MNLKLDIYNNGKVIKTYEANKANLSVRVARELLKVIDIDKLTDTSKPQLDLGKEILNTVIQSFPLFYPVLSNIFDGITEEEFENCNFADVTNIIMEVLTFTINNLFKVGEKTKN